MFSIFDVRNNAFFGVNIDGELCNKNNKIFLYRKENSLHILFFYYEIGVVVQYKLPLGKSWLKIFRLVNI